MVKGPAKYHTQALFLFLTKSIQALGQQSPGYCAGLEDDKGEHPAPHPLTPQSQIFRAAGISLH